MQVDRCADGTLTESEIPQLARVRYVPLVTKDDVASKRNKKKQARQRKKDARAGSKGGGGGGAAGGGSGGGASEYDCQICLRTRILSLALHPPPPILR